MASLPLRLEAGDPADPDRITGHVEIAIEGEPLAMEIVAPAGPTTMAALLPIVHGLTNAVVARGVAKVEAAGARISCAAGCGACCRQLVPLAESELRALAQLVDAMPEPRQSAVRARFADAMAAMLADAETMALLNTGGRNGPQTMELVLRYFRLGIACPFLEDEACSIHPDRPVICREYLVTSPPEYCADLDGSMDKIERVPVVGKVAHAVLQAGGASGETTAWVPLVAALHFAATVPDRADRRPAPELLAELFARLPQ